MSSNGTKFEKIDNHNSWFVGLKSCIQLWCSASNFSVQISWWRHQMETFSVLLAICAGNSPVSSEFPSQRPVMRSFDVFLDLRLNKRLSKQSWGWWFETPSCSLWHHCNVHSLSPIYMNIRNVKHHLIDNYADTLNLQSSETKCAFFFQQINELWFSY